MSILAKKVITPAYGKSLKVSHRKSRARIALVQGQCHVVKVKLKVL